MLNRFLKGAAKHAKPSALRGAARWLSSRERVKTDEFERPLARYFNFTKDKGDTVASAYEDLMRTVKSDEEQILLVCQPTKVGASSTTVGHIMLSHLDRDGEWVVDHLVSGKPDKIAGGRLISYKTDQIGLRQMSSRQSMYVAKGDLESKTELQDMLKKTLIGEPGDHHLHTIAIPTRAIKDLDGFMARLHDFARQPGVYSLLQGTAKVKDILSIEPSEYRDIVIERIGQYTDIDAAKLASSDPEESVVLPASACSNMVMEVCMSDVKSLYGRRIPGSSCSTQTGFLESASALSGLPVGEWLADESDLRELATSRPAAFRRERPESSGTPSPSPDATSPRPGSPS